MRRKRAGGSGDRTARKYATTARHSRYWTWRGGEAGRAGEETGEDAAAVERIEQQVEAKNQLALPALEDVPVVGAIAEKTGDLIETAGVKAVDAVGDWIGVDLDNPQSLGAKIDGVTAALSDPQNVERMKEAARNGAKLGGVLLEASSPFVEKFVDEAIPIAQNGIEKASKATVATGVNLLEDIAGPLIGIPRTLLSAAEAVSATVNAGAGLVKKGSETIDATLENYDRLVQQQQVPQMPQAPEMPRMPNMPVPAANIPFSSSSSTANKTMRGGSSRIAKLQKERSMIGGRVHKSTNAFFRPFSGTTATKNKTVRRRRW